MADAAFNRDRLQAALGKLRERLAELKDQEENARRQVVYDKAKAVRDELADELADLYPAFAQKLSELLLRAVINDREIEYINNHALPKGADRLLVAELRPALGREFHRDAAHHQRVVPATMASALELSMATEKLVVRRTHTCVDGRS